MEQFGTSSRDFGIARNRARTVLIPHGIRAEPPTVPILRKQMHSQSHKYEPDYKAGARTNLCAPPYIRSPSGPEMDIGIASFPPPPIPVSISMFTHVTTIHSPKTWRSPPRHATSADSERRAFAVFQSRFRGLNVLSDFDSCGEFFVCRIDLFLILGAFGGTNELPTLAKL